MSKPFFEVFPTLKVKDDIQMMFQESFFQFNKGFYPCQPLQQTSDPEKTYLRSRTPAKTAAVCQKSYPGVGKRAV